MKSILIVEDDEKLAFGLSIRLKAHGYTTWVAGEAFTAVSLALSHKPDLIVLDLTLAAGNGFAVAERLNELAQTRHIPVIMATGSGEPDLYDKARELGAVALLRKPYDASALLTIVQHALAIASGHLPYSRPPLPEPKHTRKKILIVEDDERVARALSVRLQSAGFDICVASDGLAGVRCAVVAKPDAVVLDVSLPAGDGFSVAKRIQANIPSPIPLIFLTASKRQEFRQRAQELGAVGFFEKPYQPEALIAAIHRATG